MRSKHLHHKLQTGHCQSKSPLIHQHRKSMRTLDAFFEELHESVKTASLYDQSYYWLLLMSMGFANIADSAEVGCMGFLITEDAFIQEIFKGERGTYGASFTGSIFAGMLVGGMITGGVGDQLGRRSILLLGLILNSISGIGASLSPTITVICIFRFIGGLGVGAVMSSLVPLVTELSPASKRGAYITFIHAFLPIGGLFVGGLAMFMLSTWQLSWRLFMAACSIPSLLGVISVYYVVPESPRYLAMQGYFKEATKEANRVAYAMGYQGPMLQEDELQFHFSSTTNKMNSNGKGELEARYLELTWSKLLNVEHLKSTIQKAVNSVGDLYCKELRNHTIILQIVWFCIGSGSSFGTWMLAIFENVNIQHLYLTLFLFWVANVPGLFASGLLLDKIGRKQVLLFSMFCTGVSLLFFARASHLGAMKEDSSELYVMASSFIFHAFLVMALTANGIISSETFPTKVRATGLGVCSASARVAMILFQFSNGAYVSQPGFLLSISSIPIFLGAFASFFLNETKNKVLTDELRNAENKNPKHEQHKFADNNTDFINLDYQDLKDTMIA